MPPLPNVPGNCVNRHLALIIKDLLKKQQDTNPESKLVFVYRKALSGIVNHNEYLENGHEAKKRVKGIGAMIANVLDKELAKRRVNGEDDHPLLAGVAAGAAAQPTGASPPVAAAGQRRSGSGGGGGGGCGGRIKATKAGRMLPVQTSVTAVAVPPTMPAMLAPASPDVQPAVRPASTTQKRKRTASPSLPDAIALSDDDDVAGANDYWDLDAAPPVPQAPRPTVLAAVPAAAAPLRPAAPPPSKRRATDYVPRFRTSNYAVLLTLLEYLYSNPQQTMVPWPNLVDRGAKYCPDALRTSGRSNLKTLVDRGLVECSAATKCYFLTDEGIELAERLYQSAVGQETHLFVKPPEVTVARGLPARPPPAAAAAAANFGAARPDMSAWAPRPPSPPFHEFGLGGHYSPPLAPAPPHRSLSPFDDFGFAVDHSPPRAPAPVPPRRSSSPLAEFGLQSDSSPLRAPAPPSRPISPSIFASTSPPQRGPFFLADPESPPSLDVQGVPRWGSESPIDYDAWECEQDAPLDLDIPPPAMSTYRPPSRADAAPPPPIPAPRPNTYDVVVLDDSDNEDLPLPPPPPVAVPSAHPILARASTGSSVGSINRSRATPSPAPAPLPPPNTWNCHAASQPLSAGSQPDLAPPTSQPSPFTSTAARPALARSVSTDTGLLRAAARTTAPRPAAPPPTWTPLRVCVLPADQYDILLVLDIREKLARTFGDRDTYRRDCETFRLELTKAGINVATAQLPVGDMLWIARARPAAGAVVGGYAGAGVYQNHPDIVLDYVVERKRIDDFVSSIKDERWKEQKWRLAQSGVPNLLYIVEESNKHMSAVTGMEGAVQTAKMQTVLWSHFNLKITKSSAETVQWLAQMTRTMERIWLGHPVYYLLPQDVPSREQWLAYKNYGVVDSRAQTLTSMGRAEYERIRHMQGSADRCRTAVHLSLPTFSTFSDKTQNVVLCDLFTQLLTTVRQMSHEKARFITKHFPTPKSLYMALRNTPEAERPVFLQRFAERIERESGVPLHRKKPGEALSKTVANVFMSHQKDM
ncbi:Crossover junction endonuclease mus81 [Allomyces arbusculus]|nr:Crossover junction endonuclease mus81 [Allomyces arbusculus]